MEQADLFGTEKISKILFRLAPPVMLAQLIQDFIILSIVCLWADTLTAVSPPYLSSIQFSF